MLEELTGLLGSGQLYSTALRPQSLGADERGHRDLRNGLAILVDAFIRANPRNWPVHVRYLECKVRHHELACGITPYQSWHGFSGMSGLASALKAFEEIPVELVHTEWLKGIVEEANVIKTTLNEMWVEQAKARTRKMAETTRPPPFKEGDVVLVTKPHYERGTGMILPKCDGPYVIDRLLDAHVCTLVDAVSGRPFQKGQRISLARLVLYKYPKQFIVTEVEDTVTGLDLSTLKPGTFVAVEHNSRTHVARVSRTFPANDMLEVDMFEVDERERFGPWNRRKWKLCTDHLGAPRREIIPRVEVLSEVVLQDGALTDKSVEDLTLLGVPVSTVPHRDKTMPGRDH